MPHENLPIAAAAMEYAGKLYVGERHLEIYDEIAAQHTGVFYSQLVRHQGFVLADGSFLTCEEAKTVAAERGAVRPGRDKYLDPRLDSGDLPRGMITRESVAAVRALLARRAQ